MWVGAGAKPLATLAIEELEDELLEDELEELEELELELVVAALVVAMLVVPVEAATAAHAVDGIGVGWYVMPLAANAELQMVSESFSVSAGLVS